MAFSFDDAWDNGPEVTRKPVRHQLVLGDGFDNCLPVLKAGTAAIGLWARCALWSAQNSPGVVSYEIVHAYGEGPGQVGALLDAGLWQDDGSGYRMVPFEQWRIIPIYRRQPIQPALRRKVYERDGNACVECGSADDLTLDHIFPWSLGGPDTEENLRTLCRSCNSRKGARV